jgi:hypothetical protein
VSVALLSNTREPASHRALPEHLATNCSGK